MFNEKELQSLNEVKNIIDYVKENYIRIIRKYKHMKGSCMDGGFWDEIDANKMSDKDYEDFIKLREQVKWLDKNLDTILNLEKQDLYFVDRGEK